MRRPNHPQRARQAGRGRGRPRPPAPFPRGPAPPSLPGQPATNRRAFPVFRGSAGIPASRQRQVQSDAEYARMLQRRFDGDVDVKPEASGIASASAAVAAPPPFDYSHLTGRKRPRSDPTVRHPQAPQRPPARGNATRHRRDAPPVVGHGRGRGRGQQPRQRRANIMMKPDPALGFPLPAHPVGLPPGYPRNPRIKRQVQAPKEEGRQQQQQQQQHVPIRPPPVKRRRMREPQAQAQAQAQARRGDAAAEPTVIRGEGGEVWRIGTEDEDGDGDGDDEEQDDDDIDRKRRVRTRRRRRAPPASSQPEEPEEDQSDSDSYQSELSLPALVHPIPLLKIKPRVPPKVPTVAVSLDDLRQARDWLQRLSPSQVRQLFNKMKSVAVSQYRNKLTYCSKLRLAGTRAKPASRDFQRIVNHGIDEFLFRLRFLRLKGKLIDGIALIYLFLAAEGDRDVRGARDFLVANEQQDFNVIRNWILYMADKKPKLPDVDP